MTVTALNVTPEWMDDAVCARTDPEAFFPGKGGSTELAKLICNGSHRRGVPPCPVRRQCLEYALLTNQEFGIWGGTSRKEREALRREAA